MYLKTLLPLILLFALIGCGTTAQSSHSATTSSSSDSDSVLIIDATGQAVAVADMIYFTVNISRYHQSARTAFSEHKDLERKLVEIIEGMGIAEDKIRANPIQINQRQRQNDRGYETRQVVTLEMDDVALFEEFQIELIEAGFDQFSGSFASTKAEEAKDEALENAVAEARRKATILARKSGKRVGSVIQIEFTSSSGPVLRGAGNFAQMEVYDGGLLRFERSIPVEETVRVTFSLE
ncbi:MAG: SIMPL domain-containing protein [Balneolaceae bacterium]|nr:SIMPL domain-containing protein [Balneolaceae bacterium]MCH8547960.1 SIMPL domain-containing protein [Balneolaceae bacterium]